MCNPNDFPKIRNMAAKFAVLSLKVEHWASDWMKDIRAVGSTIVVPSEPIAINEVCREIAHIRYHYGIYLDYRIDNDEEAPPLEGRRRPTTEDREQGESEGPRPFSWRDMWQEECDRLRGRELRPLSGLVGRSLGQHSPREGDK